MRHLLAVWAAACKPSMAYLPVSCLPSCQTPRMRVPRAGKQGQADDEVVVAQMREVLQGRLRALGGLQPPPEATACLEVRHPLS